MAKISIRVRDEFKAAVESGRLIPCTGYEVLIDDREVSLVTAVSIEWDVEGVPSASIEFLVNHLEVDAVALASLTAHVKSEDKVEAA